MSMTRLQLTLALALLCAACGDDAGPAADAGGADAGSGDAGPALPADAGPAADAGRAADAGPSAACPPDSAWGDAMTAFEDAVRAEIDARRATALSCGGASYGPSEPLTLVPALRRAARCQATYMAMVERVTNEGPDSALYVERAAAAGYAGEPTGVGFGQILASASAAALVEGLLRIDTNCASFLAADTTDIGVGVAPMAVGPDGDQLYYELIVGR